MEAKMGSILRLVLLSLFFASRAVVVETFTLDEVESQISDFIHNFSNGTIISQRDYIESSLPTGCGLAAGH
jgi:hypothetical protein